MSMIVNMSRRDFLKTGALLGSGLVLGISFSAPASARTIKGRFMPNAFIRISTGGVVTVIVNKSEMGQGVYTSLPMMIAEELEVDVAKVRFEAAPVHPAYNHTEWGPIQGTGGSSSVRSTWDQFRTAGAAARIMMITAAAALWKVDPSECRAEKGTVYHHTSGRKAAYGTLVSRASELEPPKDVPLKEPKDFKVIGRPTNRLDSEAKVNGTAVFGLDVKVPGMVVAVVARPPVFGARPVRLTAGNIFEIPGVRDVIEIPSGIAVVADDFWTAKRGRDALEIVWDEGPNAGMSTEQMRQQYAALAETPGAVARSDGDVEAAMKNISKTVRAEYEVPFLAHAPMEPLNCVVHLRNNGCDIWTGTQLQTTDRDAAARVAGLDKESVRIHTVYLGGGFGRRANPKSDFVIEAVEVAKKIGKPVKVIWTREDDMRGGFYRPFWYDRISAGLDSGGMPVAWKHTIVGQSIIAGTPFQAMIKNGIDETSVEGAHDIPYNIPNVFVDLHTTDVKVPVLWWRSVGHSHTAFVVESFIDELAHRTWKDPLAYRMQLLSKSPRHQAVLALAALKAGWGKDMAPGSGMGLAVHASFGSYVAQVAEVSVNSSGAVRVHKVVCAIDCGRVVNPKTVEAQMESGIVFGLSAALYGAITFKDGKVEQSNFHDYPILRMNEMPIVEVHIIESGEKPQGVGEPGVPPIAPAVCNAIFAATKMRIRRLPVDTGLLKIG